MHLTPWRPQLQYLGAAPLRGEGDTGTFGVDASGGARGIEDTAAILLAGAVAALAVVRGESVL